MARRMQFGAISVAAVTIIAALVLISAARDASAAANLVTNGDFVTDTANWTPLAGTSLGWAAGPTNDAGANAASGSAQLIWSNPTTAGTAILETGCITLPGAGTYALSGASKLAAANDPLDIANLRLELFTDGTCTTPSAIGAYDTPVNSTNNDSWNVLTGSIGVLGSDLSARVKL